MQALFVCVCYKTFALLFYQYLYALFIIYQTFISLIIFPPFNTGSLLDIIKHKMKMEDCKHGVFDEATVATVLREVLKGLEYFHNNGQIHRYVFCGALVIIKINVII